MNGTPRRRATCPASGFYISPMNPVRNGWANEYGLDEANMMSLSVKPEDCPDELPDGVEFVVLQFWGESRLRPAGLDRENSAVRFTGKGWRTLCWSFGWYMDNHPAGLTEPGSWYHDRKNGVLKYRLLPGESVETLNAEYPRLQKLFAIENAKDLVWKDVVFSCTEVDMPECGYSVPQAELCAPDTVSILHTAGGGFFGCRFENIGGYALNMAEGCRDIAVERCTFTGCGAGAVRIGTGYIPENENDRTGGWGCNFNCFGCIILNNIFAFGTKFQLTRYGDPPGTQTPPPNGEIFSRNIVVYEDTPLFYESEWFSYSTYWDYNLYWNTKGDVKLLKFTPEEWKDLGLDVHSLIADPLIADIRGGDFTLAKDSPAWKIGFRPIDMSGVGIEK